MPTHTPALFASAVRHAVQLLRKGELVAIPTETVYGLAANALNTAAVQRIYHVKGRPPCNPIIVHIADMAQAKRCVAHWPTSADALARAFWPGPLTIVLPRSSLIPLIVTAGGPTVGLRWPSHPFVQAVIRECGFPLAAPSANSSMAVSPTSAEHVIRALGDQIPLVIDGGHSQVGIESTVIDLSGPTPRILRPGMIHAESLSAALSIPVEPNSHDQSQITLSSPGQLPRHYAPKAMLRVLNWTSEMDLLQQLSRHQIDASLTYVLAHSCIPHTGRLAGVSVIPHDPEAFARALYAELHRADETCPHLIVVEQVPDSPTWSGIADRLRRASFSPS